MSIWRKRFSGLVAVAILSGSIVGCGGGLNSLPGVTPTPVVVDGGVTADSGVSTTDIPADSDPHTILVAIGGTNETVSIPAGVAVANGQEIAIIPDGTEPFVGLQGGTRAPGDITVNGKACGAKVVNGKIHPAIGFPTGRYTLVAEGPFTIRQGSSVLTMQRVSFTFDSNGKVLSLPVKVHGSIPSNGSNNWQNSLAATYNSTYGTGTAHLTITHANGTLDQIVNLDANRVGTFHDFQDDPQSKIPKQGVDLVSFTHVAP